MSRVIKLNYVPVKHNICSPSIILSPLRSFKCKQQICIYLTMVQRSNLTT